MATQQRARFLSPLLTFCLLLNVFAVARVHPQELAHFNEIAGGPARGHLHLVDSNLDWGQDLIRLRSWLEAHPEAAPIGLAYHSVVDPEVYGINYRPAPPQRSESAVSVGPQPGWYAVSANQLVGLPFYNPDGNRGLAEPGAGAFSYFQHFEPVGRAGYGLFLFHLSPSQVATVRHKLGMPALTAKADI